jgi:hypothetical protein
METSEHAAPLGRKARRVKVRDVALPLALFVGAGSTGYPQTPGGDPAEPSFEVLVVVRPRVLDFNTLVLSYFELRTLLQAGLPVRRITDDPDDNIKAERALARRIRGARVASPPRHDRRYRLYFEGPLPRERRPCPAASDNRPTARCLSEREER